MSGGADQNPYTHDPDRSEIWRMLMWRDFGAFVAADWSMVADDFVADEFQGVDAGRSVDPKQWRLRFPDLASYRAEWLRQAEEFRMATLVGRSKLDFLFASTTLPSIDLEGARAQARKRFDGRATTAAGATLTLQWQTLYLLRRAASRWRITGFVGYLPLS